MSDSRSRKREKSPRWRKQLRYQWSLWLLRYLWLIALLAAALGYGGYHLFTGWRARDLAGKARESFEKGNYRMAWVQAQSARDLRPNDPEVLRTRAILEAKFGHPEALESLQLLETKNTLGEEEIREKANVATRFGSEEEFEESVRKLEGMGAVAEAAPLRTARAMQRGDLDRAIKEARRNLEKSDSAENKLELARLLGKRHGHVAGRIGRPAAEDVPALEEIVGIIDGLQSGEMAEPALALGLGAMPADGQSKKRWAQAGMKNVSASNPALLPAAEFLVRSGASTPEDMRALLRPVYDTATLAQRADFSLWLSRQGMPKDALTLVTAQEASDDLSAFLARTDALGKLANWQGILTTADNANKVPDSLRQLTRVWALTNMNATEEESAKRKPLAPVVEAAVQAAASEKQLRPMLSSLDSIGAGAMAEAELARLCAYPGTADAAFSLLRERIGRTGGTGALDAAYESSKRAAPNAPSVLDHGRYLELFRGLQLTPEDTTAAIAAQPAEVAPRVTHALFMLRKNDPAAAKATFDDVTVFFDQMMPAQQVVVAAYTAGTGDMALASKMRGVIQTDVLTAGETAVLDQWVPAREEQSAR